jgi:hypothetical protein
MGGSMMLLGIFGVLGGAGYLAASPLLARRDPKGARGTNAFVLAGSVLLALALPAVIGSMMLTLPLLAGVAFWLAAMSEKWLSGSVRLTSYLLSMYANVTSAITLLGRDATVSFPETVVSSCALACIGLVHYRWCRTRKPPGESAFFTRVDQRDYSAVGIFLAALMSVFFMLRAIVARLLVMTIAPADIVNAFICSQSVIVNLCAIVLMVVAFAYRIREVRNVAILLTAIGAGKVFLYDLLMARGMPLVMSVLSFGLATAVESVILGRWQRSPTIPENHC